MASSVTDKIIKFFEAQIQNITNRSIASPALDIFFFVSVGSSPSSPGSVESSSVFVSFFESPFLVGFVVVGFVVVVVVVDVVGAIVTSTVVATVVSSSK